MTQRGPWVRHRWRLVALLALVLAAAVAWIRAGTLLPTDPGARLQALYGETRLLDRHGQPLRHLTGPDHWRAMPVGLDQISDKVVAATLALEDQRFWQHPGVDPLAIARAAAQNLMRLRRFSGASTLTQQLVKQMERRPRTWSGKLVEALEAVQLDACYTKRDVLGWYLNWAPYGGLTRGVEAAARGYFGVAAADVTWAQAAYLAVLPRAPGRLDPLLHPERALAPQRRLLRSLAAAGTIDDATLQTALATPIVIRPEAQARLAPHLGDWVQERLPLAVDRPTAWLTTLDAPLQDHVTQLLRVRLAALRDRHVGNGAVVVIDNETAEVRALVGSAGYGDTGRLGANNGALALRQPGSTIKPFAFAAAFASGDPGLHPATLLPDLEAHFATPQGDYAPRNYGDDGGDHTAGPLRARLALGASVNIASVRLMERVGVQPVLDLLRRLGLQSLAQDADHYGLGLVLGDGEVTLLDLTGAFATLARLGQHQTPRWLAGVQLLDGLPLVLPRDPPTRALPATAAFQVLDILRDPAARLPSFGRGSALELPFPVAAKTGTSKGFRDNWALGATPRWTVGVWVGNFDGSPMTDVSGVTGAAPLLHQVLLHLGGNAPTDDWTPPPGLHQRAVCTLSGGLATPRCTTQVDEWFVDGRDPRPCDVHVDIALDRLTGLRAGPGCPPGDVVHEVFAILPPIYAQWSHAHLPLPPTAFSPRCPGTDPLPTDAPLILEPHAGATFVRDSTLPASMQQIALLAHGSGRLTWTVAGREVAQTQPGQRAFWTPPPGHHRVIVRTDTGQHAHVDVDVEAPLR